MMRLHLGVHVAIVKMETIQIGVKRVDWRTRLQDIGADVQGLADCAHRATGGDDVGLRVVFRARNERSANQ